MSNILSKAINVVENVRSLQIEESKNIRNLYKINCPSHSIPKVLSDVAKSIELFDQTIIGSASKIEDNDEIILSEIIKYIAEKGIDVTKMLKTVEEEIKRQNTIYDNKPLPGELGPPDRIKDQTEDMTSIKTRMGPINIAEKYKSDKEDIERGKIVSASIGGEIIADLDEVIALINGTPIDSRTPEDDIDIEFNDDEDESDQQTSEYDGNIINEMNAINKRLMFLCAADRNNPQIKAIAAKFLMIYNRIKMDSTARGAMVKYSNAIKMMLKLIKKEVKRLEFDYKSDIIRTPRYK